MTGVASDVAELASREYQYGFVTDLDTDVVPPGLSEDVIALIASKKNEPQWLLEWRLRSYRHWMTLAEPKWQNVSYAPIDYQDISYYAAPKPKAALASIDEVDPELRAMFDKLGISLGEQERLGGVAVDAIVDSVSVATTFQKKLAEAGVIFCSFSEAVQDHPDPVRRYLGSVVPFRDNFFADAQLRGVHRRVVLLHPKRRALPDGAVHLLPHQCRKYRAVRTDPHCRRRGSVRELPRGLHRADAGREPAARGGGRARRARGRPDQILHRAKLVPRRRRRPRRGLQLRDQARPVRGGREDLLDPGRDRAQP